MTQPDTTVEYQLWYDGFDGERHSLNSLDEAGLEQLITDLNDDKARRELLATTYGFTADPHEFNFGVIKVTTTTETVDIDSLNAAPA